MKLTGIAFYPAHPSNYTAGREGRQPKYFTVHHTVGQESTLRYLWGNPARNGSSHFFAHPSYAEQYVDTSDTAWTNGNWNSNLDSITCETQGDWRNGYRNQATLNTLTEIMYRCLKVYPNLQLTFHKDVSSSTTLCPADLKDKGYAVQCWNNAKNRIKVEAEAANPKAPANLRIDIPDKKVILIRDTNLWDMSFTSFATAKAVGALPKGTVIDVAGIYDHPLSKVDYYLSNYSWNKGLNNGISIADCADYVPPKPTPIPDPIKPTPTPEPPKDEGPGTLPPLPVDPNGDILKRLGALESIVKLISDFLDKIFKDWRNK